MFANWKVSSTDIYNNLVTLLWFCQTMLTQISSGKEREIFVFMDFFVCLLFICMDFFLKVFSPIYLRDRE